MIKSLTKSKRLVKRLYMTDDEILSKIKDEKDINTIRIMRRYHYTYEKALQIVAMWQALQPLPPPIYKKEGKKLRKTKWNIGEKLYENYSQWKQAVNEP